MKGPESFNAQGSPTAHQKAVPSPCCSLWLGEAKGPVPDRLMEKPGAHNAPPIPT